MKKTLILMLVLVAAMFVFTGCEDEVGAPVQPAGLSNLAIAEKITDEWATSGKVFNDPYAAEREACAACHDGAVFSSGMFVEGNPVTGTDCQACHSGTGVELMESGLVSVPFTAETIDAGASALCITCHHGRRDPADALATYSAQPESTRYTYPHYAPAAIVTGLGGMEYPGVEYASSLAHANIPNSCITCHMPETEDGYALHTFVLEASDAEASCGSCHAGITDFNLNGFQDKVKVSLDKLYNAILEDTGAVSVTTGGGTFIFTDAADNLLTRAQVSEEAYVAAYNWYTIKSEGSYGVHNPQYVKSLLNESYKALTGEEIGF